MSAFTEEFKSMRSGGAPKVTEDASKAAEANASEKAASEASEETDTDTAVLNFNLTQTLGEATADESTEAPVIPPPKAETQKKIKINGKEFNTVEEATEYAAQLEIELEKKDAFQKGVESAKPKEAAPKEIDFDEELANELFENPKEAIKKLRAKIKEQMEADLTSKDTQKAQAEAIEKQRVKTWEGFYKSNADLSDFQEEVQLVVDRNWATLEKMPVEAGMAKIAELSRAYVESMKQKLLPRQELKSKQAITAGASTSSATATKKQATEKPVSFISQLGTINRRKAGQQEA